LLQLLEYAVVDRTPGLNAPIMPRLDQPLTAQDREVLLKAISQLLVSVRVRKEEFGHSLHCVIDARLSTGLLHVNDKDALQLAPR
jgi:hypothetical protein